MVDLYLFLSLYPNRVSFIFTRFFYKTPNPLKVYYKNFQTARIILSIPLSFSLSFYFLFNSQSYVIFYNYIIFFG